MNGAPQINDRYEFYDELDLDRQDGKYLSHKVRGGRTPHGCGRPCGVGGGPPPPGWVAQWGGPPPPPPS
jgi:hypothetical protein